MYVVKKVVEVYKPTIITNLGVKMRNPVDKNGQWIGWTKDEVKNHLSSIRNITGLLDKK